MLEQARSQPPSQSNIPLFANIISNNTPLTVFELIELNASNEQAKATPEEYEKWYRRMGIFVKEGVCTEEEPRRKARAGM